MGDVKQKISPIECGCFSRQKSPRSVSTETDTHMYKSSGKKKEQNKKYVSNSVKEIMKSHASEMVSFPMKNQPDYLNCEAISDLAETSLTSSGYGTDEEEVTGCIFNQMNTGEHCDPILQKTSSIEDITVEINSQHKLVKHNKNMHNQEEDTTEEEIQIHYQGNMNRGNGKQWSNKTEFDESMHNYKRSKQCLEAIKERTTSPLHIASSKGYSCIVMNLIANGAEVNICDDEGLSPLFLACYSEHTETVKILLEKGADVNLCTPLCTMCEFENAKIANMLLEYNADVNLCNKLKLTPLQIACQEGDIYIVKLLLQYGADVNLCFEKKLNPLYVACQNEHLEIVKLLCNSGANY